jgi:hypothetical protein
MGKRRLQRAALALTIGVVGAVVPATAAFAGEWSDTKTSTCSTAISSKSGGGRGAATIHYNAYRASSRKFVVNWADSYVNNFWVCVGDYQVTPYKIKVTQQFRFEGTSLSCSGGFDVSYPGGVGIDYSCTVSGDTVTLTTSATCAIYSSSCRIDQGYMEVLANSGASFGPYIWARTTARVENSSGVPAIWSTSWV